MSVYIDADCSFVFVWRNDEYYGRCADVYRLTDIANDNEAVGFIYQSYKHGDYYWELSYRGCYETTYDPEDLNEYYRGFTEAVDNCWYGFKPSEPIAF